MMTWLSYSFFHDLLNFFIFELLDNANGITLQLFLSKLLFCHYCKWVSLWNTHQEERYILVNSCTIFIFYDFRHFTNVINKWLLSSYLSLKLHIAHLPQMNERFIYDMHGCRRHGTPWAWTYTDCMNESFTG